MSSPWAGSAGFGEIHWPLVTAIRRLLASILSMSSVALARLALCLEEPVFSMDRQPRHTEFHCTDGAVDGSLYVDGVLVGRLPGVRRL